jgi:hypothetical protein
MPYGRPMTRVLALSAALAALVLPATAHATTHVSGTLPAGATWTLAGSPYVVDGSVSVASGRSLTIEPGVVVKFNGQFGTLWVDGSLSAVGTPEQRIVFTSIQDDSVAGDTGGDGPTVGVPGQWYMISFMGGSSGFVQYADVDYGGYGSANHAYGGVHIQSGGTATFDNDRFLSNQRSGLQIGSNSGASVSNSEFAGNANGISAINAWLTLSGTRIHDNSDTGVFVNLSGYSGSPAAVNGNKIDHNGRYGVRIQVYANIPVPSQPYGHGNDIFGNGTKELYSLYNLPTSDWTDNYWGEGPGGLGIEDVFCPWAPPTTTQWHLGYWSDILLGKSPPDGPVNYATFVLPGSDPPQKCAADYVLDVPHSDSPYFP